MNPNPFTPSFGKVPPILAGRDELIATMEQALKNGGGDPNLCSLFIGPRGVGKTALMSYLAEIAPQYGWVAANVSARRGMLEDRDSSSISDIAGRLEKTPSYVRVYRKRLKEQGVIESKGRGKVVYSLPYLREYLEGEQ